MTWTGENTAPGAAALEEQAMDELLEGLDGDGDSSPSFKQVDTSWWDFSDRDATPAPELWHQSVGEGSGARELHRATTAGSRADTVPNFDERRTAVWSPSPELRARASELIGQPVAMPTPAAFATTRPQTAEGTRPRSAPVIDKDQLVFPAETPRALLPIPQRSKDHAFTPVRLQPGTMLRPAKTARGSQIPMSARSLHIEQPGRHSPPPTAMLRLEPLRPGRFARLAAWLRQLFCR
jgi:hypothetical protein